MSRYIDADELKEQDFQDYSPADVMSAIDSTPTANVVRVRHGKWLSVVDDVYFKCSLCNAEISTSWDYEEDDMFNYCPCCGARMDGDEK